MRSNRSGWKLSVVGLVAILLLSLPLVAGAQTTGGSSTASTASAATTNGITSPKEGAALSGTVEVRGYADSPDFMKWQLDLLPNGDPNAPIFLALGTTPGQFTYSFDTSKLPAGEHALRLRVVRQNSNYDEYLTKFTIGQAAAAGGTAAGVTSTGAVTTTRATTTTTTPGTPRATTGTTTAGTAATSGAGVTTNGLAAPREGQTVSGQFEVRGYAADPNFMKWQLDLLPNGEPNSAIFLAFGETSGVFTYTLNTANYPPGQHALRLRVVRNDSNYNEYTTNFAIGQAAAAGGTAAGVTSTGAVTTTRATTTTTTTAGASTSGGATTGTGTTSSAGQTTNGITAPKEGASVTGSVTVTGYADSPNFMKWQLDLLPSGDASQAAFLAFGEKPGSFTYTLDTTNLPAGEHALRLRIVRQDSNYDEYITKFTIAK
ncbi:MAG: hypothetical protein ACM30E_09420 [Nitrososphaerales archaeon]